jgi:hypothetical protein
MIYTHIRNQDLKIAVDQMDIPNEYPENESDDE